MKRTKKNETGNITIIPFFLFRWTRARGSRTLHEGDEVEAHTFDAAAPSTLATTAPSSSSAPPPDNIQFTNAKFFEGDARPKLKIVRGRFHPSSDASKAIMRIFKLHLEKDGWSWGEGVHMGVKRYRGHVQESLGDIVDGALPRLLIQDAEYRKEAEVCFRRGLG
ncbi:hypothetical protein JCGZ_22833 [Jatropha curcas]|uniref:Uncharacterized protein n=1 Tax=Jatropha curcas TaxID=180498 RepID=A0A067JQI1_JATCU|nr:hypothetical protein JCGZ_22833 [Jatropha curcas]